eukprot:761002-Hanusia_phi.AAC.2
MAGGGDDEERKMEGLRWQNRSMTITVTVLLLYLTSIEAFSWSPCFPRDLCPGASKGTVQSCLQHRLIPGRPSFGVPPLFAIRTQNLNGSPILSVKGISAQQEKSASTVTDVPSNSHAFRHIPINPRRQPGNGTSLRLSLLERRVTAAEKAVIVSRVRKIQKEMALRESQLKIRALYAKDVNELKNKRGTPLRTEMSQQRIVRARMQMANAAMKKNTLDLFISAGPNAVSRGLMPQDSPLRTSVLAGNKGFDPCCVASRDLWSGEKLPDDDDSSLVALAEAEIRHARLAMLAIVGGPASETIRRTLKWKGWGLAWKTEFDGQKFMVGALAVFLVRPVETN